MSDNGEEKKEFCVVCGKELDYEVGIIQGAVGKFHKECKGGASKLYTDKIDEARSLDIRDLPNRIDIKMFEQLIFSVAVAFVDILKEALKDPDHECHDEAVHIEENQRFLLDPSMMGQELKGRVLPHLSEWVDMEYAEGHDRLFHDGTYRWNKPVPLGDILKAFNNIGVVWPKELEGGVLDD